MNAYTDLLAQVETVIRNADEEWFEQDRHDDPYPVLAKAAVDAVVRFITERK